MESNERTLALDTLSLDTESRRSYRRLGMQQMVDLDWWAQVFTIVAGIAALLALIPTIPLILSWGFVGWTRAWLRLSSKSPLEFKIVHCKVDRESDIKLCHVFLELLVKTRDMRPHKMRKPYPLIWVPAGQLTQWTQVGSFELEGEDHPRESTTMYFRPIEVGEEPAELRLRGDYKDVDVSKRFKLQFEYQVGGVMFKEEFELPYNETLV